MVSKWTKPSKNLQEGDTVCLRKEPLAHMKWPLARIILVHPGKDGIGFGTWGASGAHAPLETNVYLVASLDETALVVPRWQNRIYTLTRPRKCKVADDEIIFI